MQTRTALLILFLGPPWQRRIWKRPRKKSSKLKSDDDCAADIAGAERDRNQPRLYASVDASLAERKYDRPLADLNRASDLAPEFALPNGSSACSNVRLCLGVRNPYLGREHRRSQSIGAMRGGEILRRCCAPWNQKVGVFSWFPSKDMVALNEWWITAQRCMWRQARNAL
jgi:hypothetical protein